jgi:TolB protein
MFKRWWVFVGLVLASVAVQAQFRVEVSGIGLTQLPIAISAFRGDDQSPQKIAGIVQADLERSGQFRSVDSGGFSMDETTRPDMSVWRQRSADSLLVGSVTRLADGRFDVRFRLWDAVRAQDLGGQSYTGSAPHCRCRV